MLRYYVLGGFTLDDTVVEGGEYYPQAVGGNAVYAAVGARIWTEGIGIVSRASHQFPEFILQRLRDAGLDLRGVRRDDLPDTHFWILYEKDGRRQLVYHLDSGRNRQVGPLPPDLPEDYRQAEAMHMCGGRKLEHLMEWMAFLRRQGTRYSIDVTPMAAEIDTAGLASAAFLRDAEVFLPSLEDVHAIWGEQELLPLLVRLCHAGPCAGARGPQSAEAAGAQGRLGRRKGRPAAGGLASGGVLGDHDATCGGAGPRVLGVKMGGQGSLIYDARRGKAFRVPACPVEARDPTGAGDAFCGGFMVGYHESGGDALEGALHGTVSASFVIEDFGALHALDADRAEALRRLQWLREHTEVLELPT